MLAAKSVIEAAVAEPNGYLFLEIDQTLKEVEIEMNNMTLFVAFSRNQSSLWNVMCRQSDDHFIFQKEDTPTGVGQDMIQRTYDTLKANAGDDFDVILCNDLVEGTIHMQITMPVSERALDKFIQWTPSVAGCCRFLAEELQLALGERSQAAHYTPGAILGDYTEKE